MNKQISKRLRALEQATKPPEAILVRWAIPVLNTLTNGGQSIQREPNETEKVFIRRGRTLLGSGIMFGQ
jgi:hypothetical protein